MRNLINGEPPGGGVDGDEPAEGVQVGWVRIEVAAERLGCGVSLVRRLVAERRIPFYKPTKYLLFDRDELDQWVRRHRTDPFI